MPGLPDIRDPNLSLREKWRLHAEHRRKTGVQPSAQVLHRWGTVTFLAVFWGNVVCVFHSAMPALYSPRGDDGGGSWIVPARLLFVVMIIETSVNWCLARWVSSEYIPAVHGTEPADFRARGGVTSATLSPSSSNSASDPPNGGTLLLSVAEAENHADGVDLKIAPASTYDVTNCGKRSNVILANGSSFPAGHYDASVGERKDSEAVDLDYAPPNPAKAGTHDGYSYRMLVATALPTSEGHVERKPFPYWSWTPCLMCQRSRPPRCHHCVLCRKCVLKRDHHCYLTGACVGANNQRFFVVFLLWASALALFGMAHMLPYTVYHVVPELGVWWADFFVPLCLARAALGYVHPLALAVLLLLELLTLLTAFSFTMLLGGLFLVVKGLTNFEREHRIKVTDTRPLAGRLRSVFGEYWWVNVLVPTYPWFKPVEDAVLWPHIKPF